MMSSLRAQALLRGLAKNSASCRAAARSAPRPSPNAALAHAFAAVRLQPGVGAPVRHGTSGTGTTGLHSTALAAFCGIRKRDAQTSGHAERALQTLQHPRPQARGIAPVALAAGAQPLITKLTALGGAQPHTQSTPFSTRSFCSNSSGRSGRQQGQQDQGSGKQGGQYHQGSTFSFNFSGAHVVCYGAMLVVSLPALGKTVMVMCEGKGPAPPSRPVTAKSPVDLNENPPVTMSDLFSILDGEWAWLGLAIAVTLVWAWFVNYMPVAYSAVTLAVQKKEPMDGPIFNFVRLQVSVMVLDSAKHFVLSTLGERIRQRLRVRLYTAMLQQEIGFFDANSKGQLMSMMGEDVARMQQAVTDNMTGTIMQLTTIYQAAKMVLSISPYATMLVVAAVPVLSAASIMAQAASRKRSSTAFESARETAATASEVLANARTVQSFTAEDMEAVRYAQSMDKQYALELDYRVFTGGSHLIFQSINMALSVGGMYYGGGLVAQGKLEMTDLMLFMQYSFKIGHALGSLLNLLNEQQRALMSASKVFGTLRRKPTIERGVGDKPHVCEGLIKIDNVTFHYPTRPESTVIKGLHLEMHPGTVTALVGGSGNGKSTIAWLLQRFYDPSEGAVTLDARDVRSLDLKWLRDQMAIVSQEPMLFHGTVADNIRYGKPGASDEEVMAAAREANAEEFVLKLPNAYQTTVSQVGLSAGQRQRISIARAILKNPRILILDEATSQLDAKSEGAVQDALDRLMKGRTVLVIAHRLSTIKDATNICVLEGGQVVEHGTHAALMRAGGIYAAMANRQMAGAKSMGA